MLAAAHNKILALASAAVLVVIISIPVSAQWRTPQPEPATVVPQAQLITPEDLVKILQSKGPKPLILNVGPRMLFAQAHIPDAEFIGQGSDPAALDTLKKRVSGLAKTRPIVLYCGCCPWSHCPNVAPAFKQLESLGFTKVKVLYIPNNLGVDWVDKGYPTAR